MKLSKKRLLTGLLLASLSASAFAEVVKFPDIDTAAEHCPDPQTPGLFYDNTNNSGTITASFNDADFTETGMVVPANMTEGHIDDADWRSVPPQPQDDDVEVSYGYTSGSMTYCYYGYESGINGVLVAVILSNNSNDSSSPTEMQSLGDKGHGGHH